LARGGNETLAQAIARCEDLGRYVDAACRELNTKRRSDQHRPWHPHPPPDSIFKQPGYTLAFPRRDPRPGRAKHVPRKVRGRREDRVPATAPTAPAQKGLRERAL